MVTQKVQTAAIVLGVLPEDNVLPGQVLACLDHAAELLQAREVRHIYVLGGYGHGSRVRKQKSPEASMMEEYLLSKGVDRTAITPIATPVTTPEALWEVRKLNLGEGRIVTIKEKQRRIGLFARKIVGGRVMLTVEAVPYILTAAERKASENEEYLFKEAEGILKAMQPGDEAFFQKVYSFEYHLWQAFVDELTTSGDLEEFLRNL